MSQLKLTADSGGGTVAIKGPASTVGNAAIELTVPGTGNATLATTADSFGKILQVQYAVKKDTASNSLATQTWWSVYNAGFQVTLTPSSASNKILLIAQIMYSEGSGQWYQFRFEKKWCF